jgi:lipopolysaccharide/colanic/teichoic acid biosynthesis glycosyltransferase
MGTESGSVPLIAAEVGGASGHGGLYAPREDKPHARTLPRGGKARPRLNGGARAPHVPVHAHWHDSVLQPGEFSEAVHRETRRSERSRAPLSMVQYSVAEAAADEPQHFERLLAVLQHSKRETDLLGHVGIDTLAILCTDTDDEGARGLVAKLAPFVADLPVAAVTATYPDHLFESLARGTPTAAAFQSLIVPNERVNKVGDYPLKKPMDIALALIALAIFGPLMLVVALLVKLTSRGPVIFKQPRLGKGGVPFTFYKFRSMVVNVDDRIHREYMANLIRGGHGDPPAADASTASYKMKADPRVTKIGKFIRMTSIDELPQLFNVLKGDMSMVGPRPPIPYEAAHYEPWHLRRILATKPGITGLWQVEGRSRVTFSEMVRMDLRYVRNCSLRIDLKILVKTVAVVLRCAGAR